MAEDSDYKLTFDHQCFLMDNADILSPLNAACGYKNFHALGQGNGNSPPNVHDVITALTGRGGLTRLTKLRPAQQGVLQPTVRLWRVFPGKADGSTVDREDEFVFEQALNSSTIEAITKGGASRAGGAGIKNFEWEFGGTNPAEAEAVINVKMTLHFQNMNELKRGWGDIQETNESGFTVDVGTIAGQRPSFMELILLPPGMKGAGRQSGCKAVPTGRQEYDPAFYKIKAQVGWAVPPGIEDQELVRELRSTQLIMYLNLLTHELKIKEDGSVDVEVEYIGSTETALNSGAADVIFPYGSSQNAEVSGGFLGIGGDDRTIEDINAEMEGLEEYATDLGNAQDRAAACGGAADEELDDRAAEVDKELAALGKMCRELNAKNRSQAYENFTKNLSGKIRHLDLDNGYLKEWEANEGNVRVPLTSDSSGGVATMTIGDQGFWSNPQEEAESADSSDVSDDDIYFVFFGDILEIACTSFSPANLMDVDNPARGMKFITGPLQYIDPRAHQKGDLEIKTINLADVPISYTMFMKFWNDRVVNAERASYPVRAFVMDIISTLIGPALSSTGCWPKTPQQKTAISTAMFTVATPGAAPRDIIAEMPGERPSYGGMAQFISDNGAIAGEDLTGFQYIFLYANTAAIADGDPEADELRGIYHFRIGEDRGMVKKIDFKKNDVQGMKEARQDESGAMAQLREMYNADITMVGNNIYIPGMTVFIWPPPGLGHPSRCGSDANLLGLGGYFNVIKVTSKIKRGGQYDTSLECMFAGARKDPCTQPACSEGAAANSAVTEDDPWAWANEAWDSMVGDLTSNGGPNPTVGVDDEDEGACSGDESANVGDGWFDWF
jgi:hypothetical protein